MATAEDAGSRRGVGRPAGRRPAWAGVDLAAVAHNLGVVRAAAGRAGVLAVVKADAYGHGAVPVARALLDAGVAGLAVALVEEGAALREAGLGGQVLVLSEPPPEAMAEVVELGLDPTLYTMSGVRALAGARRRSPAAPPTRVHVKVDTGMHRVGAAPAEAESVALAAAGLEGVEVAGVCTHFAAADDPAQAAFTARQRALFDGLCLTLAGRGLAGFRRHAANSAGVLMAGATYDLVRPGIALYGYHPDPTAEAGGGLTPVLSLVSAVVHLRRLEAGEGVSYGRRYRLERPSVVATVPLGYADGVPRRLFETGGQVLVGGRRRPIAGTVTMDQLMVDCGPGSDVAVGDEVVLLGRQGDEVVDASEWARRLGTISYEVLCSIGPRVPRSYGP